VKIWVAVSIVGLASSMASPVTATPEVGVVPVVRAETKPALDGVAETLWDAAVVRRLERSKGPIPASADVQGSFRAMWDETALYVLVEVLDDWKQGGEGDAPWGDDGVEVYVDGDLSRSSAYDGRNDRQYVFRWNDLKVTETKQAATAGIRFAQAEWDHGYRFEIALPWAAIGNAPGAGIGLDVHVNDNDGAGRESKLMWSDTEDRACVDPRRFGKATLLATSTAPAEVAAVRSVPAADLQAETEPPLRLQYHDIRKDAEGLILPWSHDQPAQAYDHVVRLVWDFWRRLESCPNGVPYYLQHQVWKPEHDRRGLGGDQISMALSSWNLLHGYLGDPAVVEDMRLQADYWLDHGFTGASGPWPNLPFPYNTDIHSGRYDGDMIAGKGYLQPDKAGSFGAELLTLFKITDERRYLDAAIGIADTLARNAKPGDAQTSPWPFRVHAETGEVFQSNRGAFSYTTNWTGALRLFDGLIEMGKGRVSDYELARTLVEAWLQAYPLNNQRWGPFFEDINIYSDTQINAGTLALYILEHPTWIADDLAAVRRILDWTDAAFGNAFWSKYGVRATNEQTAYEVPGNSHTSRQASLELLWAERSADASRKAQAIRNLSWATYMVDDDGKNRYYRDDIWLTDGYGDYVRHYLRAMAAAPELAPDDQNHLLRTTSVIRGIHYGDETITYEKWDADSHERLKLGAWAPGEVTGGTYTWDPVTRVLDVTSSARAVRIRRAE
jgi:hypothetical protein